MCERARVCAFLHARRTYDLPSRTYRVSSSFFSATRLAIQIDVAKRRVLHIVRRRNEIFTCLATRRTSSRDSSGAPSFVLVLTESWSSLRSSLAEQLFPLASPRKRSSISCTDRETLMKIITFLF